VMLPMRLHRRLVAAKADVARAVARGEAAVEETHKLFGIRLLIAGLLWISVYLLSRGVLALGITDPAARVLIALTPVPFFVYYLWVWMKGVRSMDELQRRIEFEALALAFPLAIVVFMTLGLLDVAIPRNLDDYGFRHWWLMLPLLYYVGLWRAKRRYE
ncbi:MAG: hypothetical protein AB7N29_23525, partial [Vicinamibacterales bacterium]